MNSVPSPIDGAPMRKVERYGVELDVCTRSGGVWLDKGELEKIILLVREESDGGASQMDHRHDPDEFDDVDDHRRGRKGRRSRLMDIFDF